jgi:hypothetical protein
MTEEKKTYKDHVDELLNKVNKGEVVYPPPAPIPFLHKEIKEHGVKKVLTSLFTETYDVPHFLNEDQIENEIEGYELVSPPSQYKDADAYWNDISSNFLHLGQVISNDHGCIETKVMSANNTEETLRICLVRDATPEKQDKPSIAFIYLNGKITPMEVISFINKVGLTVDRTEIKQVNNWIVANVAK